MNHTHHIFVRTCLAIILFGGLWLVYLLFLDGTIINPTSSSFKPRVYQTTQATYKTGDDVIVYSSAFCKYRAVPATVYWSLEDDVLLSYPGKATAFPAGCYDASKQIEVEVLPGYIGNHQYRFVGKVVYHLVGRDVTVSLSTNYFYVSPK